MEYGLGETFDADGELGDADLRGAFASILGELVAAAVQRRGPIAA